jgi:hypothetical protein
MPEPLQNQAHKPEIILLSSHIPFPVMEDHKLIEGLLALDDTITREDIHLSWDEKTPQRHLGNLHFGVHRIKLSTVPAPLPAPLVDRTINVSHWQPDVKAMMRQHRSQMVCAYQGESADPVERMIALYRTAGALHHEGMLAIANESAWTAHPPIDFLTADNILSFRKDLPFILWFGYVKFFVNKHSFWLATKGHHLFDVPDLASLVISEAEFESTMNLFINIFQYLYENDVVVTAGDTMEIQGSQDYLRFSEVDERDQYLMGPAGTLVLERIGPEAINR